VSLDNAFALIDGTQIQDLKGQIQRLCHPPGGDGEGSLGNPICGVCMLAGVTSVMMDGTMVDASLGNMALATGAASMGVVPGPSGSSDGNSTEGNSDNSDPAAENNASDPNADPCGMCIYLNDAGTGVTFTGNNDPSPADGQIDQTSNQGECESNVGVFIDESNGAQTINKIYSDPNSDNILVSTAGPGGNYSTWGAPGQQDVTTYQNNRSIQNSAAWSFADWQLGYNSSVAVQMCGFLNTYFEEPTPSDVLNYQMCVARTGAAPVPCQ
jgi:hypothetical protein